MELLVPAGNWDCLEAAVMHGADAVYFGGQHFNARQYADNFDEDMMRRAVDYCHLYDVRVYVTVNTIIFDREREELFHYADFLSQIGVDAVIVQDIGAVSIIREAAPELPIHASTQMAIHDLPGVLAAKEIGISRVVLAREASLGEIQRILKSTDVELEVFGHGALCMCYSGQCYMSSIIGGRSGNRGKCAQPCRLEYRIGNEEGQLLSLKDLCCLEHINAFKEIGVSSLKIEGRMKGIQYVSTVTEVYRDCLDGKRPDSSDYNRLRAAFDRGGFTDGYLTGKIGREMFSYQRPQNPYRSADCSKKRKRIFIQGTCTIEKGKPVSLTITDGVFTKTFYSDAFVEEALTVSISRERVLAQLEKTNDTPFVFSEIQLALEEGCAFPIRELNALRRMALDFLKTDREQRYKRVPGFTKYKHIKRKENRYDEPKCFVSVETHEQAMAVSLYTDLLFLPPELWDKRGEYKVPVALIVPRMASEKRLEELHKLVEQDNTGVLVSDIGQVNFFKNCVIYGGFELNVANSDTISAFKKMGLQACGLSYELSLRRIQDLEKAIPVFIFAYGYMPLMITKNCLIHSATGSCNCPTELTDRTGATFSVVRGEGCVNEIRNGTVLFNGDKLSDFYNIGLSALFLRMTTESPKQCKEILEAYRGAEFKMPKKYTRGHLYKIVE